MLFAAVWRVPIGVIIWVRPARKQYDIDNTEDTAQDAAYQPDQDQRQNIFYRCTQAEKKEQQDKQTNADYGQGISQAIQDQCQPSGFAGIMIPLYGGKTENNEMRDPPEKENIEKTGPYYRHMWSDKHKDPANP